MFIVEKFKYGGDAHVLTIKENITIRDAVGSFEVVHILLDSNSKVVGAKHWDLTINDVCTDDYIEV